MLHIYAIFNSGNLTFIITVIFIKYTIYYYTIYVLYIYIEEKICNLQLHIFS